jgi:putative membrane protein
VALGCIIWSHKGKSNSFWQYLAICGVFGWSIECLGVYTGFPFGDYHYHETLGLQLFNIPLMTGVIWWLTCFGASAVATEIADSTYSRVLLAALLMVVFDLPVEHVSGKMGMWHWESGFAPIQNYLGWFACGIILQYLLQILTVQKRNFVAIAYFITAFIFFIALDIITW